MPNNEIDRQDNQGQEWKEQEQEPLVNRLVNGIPHGRAAIVTLFLLQHQEGLATHPYGMDYREIRQGMSHMLGLSPTEERTYLRDPSSFSQFLNNLPQTVIQREGTGPNAKYTIRREDRYYSEKYSEIMLQYSATHPAPFDGLLVKDKRQKHENTLPLRFQIAEYVTQQANEDPLRSIAPLEIAEQLKTTPQSVRTHLQALNVYGIEYDPQEVGRSIYYVTLKNFSEEPIEAETQIKKHDVLRQAFVNLKKLDPDRKYTINDIQTELRRLDPYFRTIDMSNFAQTGMKRFLENTGVQLQTYGATLAPESDLPLLLYQLHGIGQQDMSAMKSALPATKSQEPDDQSQARRLWIQSDNYRSTSDITRAPSTIPQETSIKEKSHEYNPLQLTERLNSETMKEMIHEVNTIRKAIITQTLLELQDTHPYGIPIRIIRSNLQKKLDLTTPQEIEDTLGKKEPFQALCLSLEGPAIKVDRSAGIIQFSIDPQFRSQLQEYVALMLDYTVKHEASPEIFLPRRRDEIHGKNGLPLSIETAKAIIDTCLQDGQPTDNKLLKDELVARFGTSYENINRILRQYQQENLISLTEIPSGASELWFRRTDADPINVAFNSSLQADIYQLLTDLRNEKGQQMYSRPAIIHLLQTRLPEKYGQQALSIKQASFEREVYTALSPTSFSEQIVHVYQQIPNVRVRPNNDWQSLYDFMQIIEQNNTDAGLLEEIFAEGNFMQDFLHNKNPQQARSLWEQSKQMEPRARRQTLEETTLHIKAALSHLKNQAGKTYEILPEMNKSIERTQAVLATMRRNWQIIGVQEGRDTIWKLPNNIEELEMKYLQILVDGGAIHIRGQGKSMDVVVYPNGTQEYEEATKGREVLLEDSKLPVINIRDLNKKERYYIIKSRSLQFALDEEQKLDITNYENSLELFSLLEFSLLSEYKQLRSQDGTLPMVPPFGAIQLGEWLAQSAHNPYAAIRPTVPLGSYSRRRVNSMLFEPEQEMVMDSRPQPSIQNLEEQPEVNPLPNQQVIVDADTLKKNRKQDDQWKERREISDEDKEVLSSFQTKRRRYDQLTTQEKDQLWFTYQNPRNESIKEECEEKLYLLNVALVQKLARSYMGFGISLDDLVQEGSIGLLTAIRKFEPEKGFAFSTHAVLWIRQAIGRALADKAQAIRIPVYMHTKINEYRRQRSELATLLGEEPTMDDMMKKYDFSEEHVTDMESLLQLNEIKSLDRPIEGQKGDSTQTLYDTLAQSSLTEDFTEEIVLKEELNEQAQALLSMLTERERAIIAHRFGFIDQRDWTLEEVGKKFGISKERVRQIEEKAL